MNINDFAAVQVPKDELAPESIEDKLDYDTNAGLFVISDGASESYESKTFAKLLCQKFIDKPNVTSKWIKSLIGEYSLICPAPVQSWSKMAAYERGSFATLLTFMVSFSLDSVRVFAVGDSQCFLLHGEKVVHSFPYRSSREFRNRPQLLSTKPAHNSLISTPNYLERHTRRWHIDINKAPVLLGMTDALGEWALRKSENAEPQWTLLSSIDKQGLQALVLQEWSKKEMRKDDITLMRISFKY